MRLGTWCLWDGRRARPTSRKGGGLMTRPADMEHHPDLLELRARYEVAGQSPTAQFSDGLTLLAGLYLALSPWIVGFSGLAPITINNLVIGLAIAGLAIGFSSAFG